jgi:TrmH family RNA methyltransferase
MWRQYFLTANLKKMLREITSLQHPLIKHLVKLRDNRGYRYDSRSVVISGLNLIRELAPRFTFRALLLAEKFEPEFRFSAKNVYKVPLEMIKKVTGLENPEPIAAEIEMPVQPSLTSLNFLLILDGIADPGNLGTLLRTACGLGWDGAFLTPRSADPFNDKALRAAKGATFKLPWKIGSIEELFDLLKKNKMVLFAADAKGKDFFNQPFRPPLALALGNEAHGLAAPLKQNAELIAIPMEENMESLNVASAGAILMYTLKKRP